jgi:hypothetical protein
MLTFERANELFVYDPGSGLLFRKLSHGKPCEPRPMLTRDNDGYIVVKADGRSYKAHRVAWLLAKGAWPEKMLDHIDGNRGNNRMSNLREVTRSQNQYNRKVMGYALSGLKGASYNARDRKWQATIRIDGKSKNLGYFDTAEAAHLAYCEAASRHFGEYFCDGKRA